MKNPLESLTDGMQRLCAVANRVVAAGGKVSRIERDLLLDDLRRLYDIALMLDVQPGEEPQAEAVPTPEVAHDASEAMLASTVAATIAALNPEPPMPIPAAEEPEPVSTAPAVFGDGNVEPAPQPEPEPEPTPESEPAAPASMAEFEAEGMLLFDEVVTEESEPEPEPAAVATAPAASGGGNTAPEPAFEPEPEPQPAPAPVPQPKPATQPEPHHAARPVERQVSLLDYLKQPASGAPAVRTLGESLAATRTVGLDGLARKVDDLRTVININDKFSFMSELFKNNMRAYNDFIMHLNSLDLREEALAYVAETARQYGWDEASATVQTFRKIFDKKF